MSRNAFSMIHASILALLLANVSAQLPYNPTSLLRSSSNDSLLYIFSDKANSEFELSYLNTSLTLDNANVHYTTLSQPLPFLADKPRRPFAPTIGRDGNITVYTGDCGANASALEVWRYIPNQDLEQEGAWTQLSIETGEADTLGGAKYLTTGLSFASKIHGTESDSSMYFLGGMCPYDNSTEESWQSSAEYSNIMLSVTPTNDDRETSYNLNMVSSHEPLIAQAGYAVAPLQATFSNLGGDVQVQQQDFVIVGGQTELAWINMSRIALFSLPQESFAYIDVEAPNTQHTDLAVREDITEIQPRSGHTAILSEDGRSIIVYGGWVGDVSNAAEPQLAILQLGSDYGGQGPWTWTAPISSGPGPSGGSAIFGHGAALLPGNTLMVSGGFTIPSPTSRLRHQNNQSRNSDTYFYNLDSNSWSSSYSPPSKPEASESKDSGPLATTSQKAGLGAGLGLGAVALVGLVGFYVWYRRRTGAQKEWREKEIHVLASTTYRIDNNPYGDGGLDGRGANPAAAYYFPPSHDHHPGWRTKQGQEAERTGLLVEIPSPTRGLRRGLASRPVARTDGRLPPTSGYIHPIDELEEDEEEEHDLEKSRPRNISPEMVPRPESSDRSSLMAGGLNPLGSHPVRSQSPIRPYKPSHSHTSSRSTDWTQEMEQKAAGVFFTKDTSSSSSGGRTSPSKSERTISNLSDRSMRSNLSARSSNGVPISRNLSLRSSTLLNSFADPFVTPETSPTAEHPSDRNSRGFRPASRAEISDRSDSFTTAKSSSFTALQVEGQALLGGRPEYDDAGYFPDENDAEDEHFEIHRRERSRSLLGNVRRAIGRTMTRTASDSKRPSSMVERSSSLLNRLDMADKASHGPSHSPSPTKPHHSASVRTSSPPRRAASDASFWRSKRGAKDWGIDPNASPSADPSADFRWRRNSGDDWGSPEDKYQREREEDEDWDVEGAAESRDVQVTFTVPRQRLRIVNKTSMASFEVEPEDMGGGEDKKTGKERMGMVEE